MGGVHNIPIVYEDDWLIVYNKPSGLLVVPAFKKESRTLTSITGNYPCHRLDRETSGLIIYAKTRNIQDKMADEFRKRQVHKTYIAFVQGRVQKNQGQINNRIEGQEALTKYKVLEARSNFAIVEVWPITGRTNQVRIHFKAIGNPLVGEDKFAFRRDFALKFKRLCLHAKRLEFKHPVTGKKIELETDLPKDLEEFLTKNA